MIRVVAKEDKIGGMSLTDDFFLWTRCRATPRASAICGTVRGPPSCRLLNSPHMTSDQMES